MDSRLLSLFLKFSKVAHPKVSSKLGGLKSELAKTSLRISFRAYLGLTVFSFFITFVCVLGVSFPLFYLLSGQVLQAAMFSAFSGIIGGFLALAVCFAYPKLVVASKGNKIDSNLATIANFMSVLASSGMPPENIFRSLARVGSDFNVKDETADIIRDIEFLGLDLLTALKRASLRSPSKNFSVMLDGAITTSHMGGDLAGYLREQSNKFKNMKILKMRSFLDNLGVIAEVYVTFMVAAPLMLIVMLSVMSFIGGGAVIGNLDPRVLLDLLTFLVTPVGVIVLILAVDSIMPQR